MYCEILTVSHLICGTVPRGFVLLHLRRTYDRLYLRFCKTWLFTLHSGSGALEISVFISASEILQMTVLVRTNSEMKRASTHTHTHTHT